NSLSSATDTTIEVLGFPLAGALVGGLAGSFATDHGIDFAFYIDAGTYLFSAIMIYQMSVPHSRPDQPKLGLGTLLRMVGSGLRFVRSNATLLTNTLIIACGALIGSGTLTLAYGYAAWGNMCAFGYLCLEARIMLWNVICVLI